MTSLVSIYNSTFTLVFGWVYTATKWLGAMGSLVALSFLGGILMVWIFGKVSNQDAIKATRNRMNAELIALRLFKDDLRIFFRIQKEILLWTLKYLKHSMIPMVIIMIPVMAILIQLNLHYAVAPLEIGKQALVKVILRDAKTLEPGTEISLQAGDSLTIETQGVRIPENREISWRVRGVAADRFDLVVTAGKDSVSKQMAVGGAVEGVSSLRTGEHWLTNLLYPAEAPIPAESAIESIEVLYPELPLSFFGWGMDWMIVFFVLSMVFGFAFKGTLGVQI